MLFTYCFVWPIINNLVNGAGRPFDTKQTAECGMSETGAKSHDTRGHKCSTPKLRFIVFPDTKRSVLKDSWLGIVFTRSALVIDLVHLCSFHLRLSLRKVAE